MLDVQHFKMLMWRDQAGCWVLKGMPLPFSGVTVSKQVAA